MANEIGGISVKLSADVDASGAVKGMAQIEQASEKIQKEFQQTEAVAKSSNAAVASSTTNAASASKKATSAFKMQKGSMAQLGQQIQDVAVMTQFGADKFIILGTQGSQIASLFGPGGAVFGAVLAISAAIGGTLVKSIDAAKDASADLPKELMTRLEQIKERFAEVDEASRGAFLGVEFNKLNQEYDQLSEKIKTTEQRIVEQSQAFNGNGNAVTRSLERLEKLKQEQKDVASLMEQLTKVSTEDLGKDEIDFSVDGGDAGVKSRVEAMRAGLAREQELYQAWRQTRKGITDGIISDEQAQLIEADVAAQQRINAQFDQTKARLEEERQLLLENQTLTAEEKAARQAEIDAAEREAKAVKDNLLLQQEQEFQNDMTAIEERAARARIKLAEMEKNAKIGYMSSMFGNLSSLMNTESRKLFEIGKAAAVANAVVDGYAAVSKTMASVPYPFNIPLAAAQAAASAAQVSGIMSTKFGSASTGQSYSGGQVVNNTASTQTQQAEQRNISIALTGSGFSGGDIRGLISAINEELGDGVTLSATGG